jgi:hypothetical protein
MMDNRSGSSRQASEKHEKILWVKAKAGLGNRMLALGTAYVYAQLSGRALYVDWADDVYSSNGENVFGKLFVSGEILGERPVCDENTSIVRPIWEGRLALTASAMIDKFDASRHSAKNIWRKYSISLNRLGYDERIAVYWSFSSHLDELRRHMSKCFRYHGKTDREILADIYQNSIRIHPDIAERVEDFARANAVDGAIGVHVRYMDKRVSVADFLPYIRRIADANPSAPIFLATDNREADRFIREKYPRVIATPKWYPEGGTSMHQNPECPDRLRNAVEALIDMYLLARCRWLIFPGRSTFSLISSLISKAPPENIHDVDRNSVHGLLRAPANFVWNALGAARYR